MKALTLIVTAALTLMATTSMASTTSLNADGKFCPAAYQANLAQGSGGRFNTKTVFHAAAQNGHQVGGDSASTRVDSNY